MNFKSCCGRFTSEQVLAFSEEHDCVWVKFGVASGAAYNNDCNLPTLGLLDELGDEGDISNREHSFMVRCAFDDIDRWGVSFKVAHKLLGTGQEELDRINGRLLALVADMVMNGDG